MDTKGKQNSPKEVFKFISTILSWTLFVLLLLCVILLLYYFISTKIYATKGEKYEPKFSLYTIISGSMIPNILVYDVVINLRVDSTDDIQIGDVITFISESTESMGDTVTHRVVSIIRDDNGNVSYQTKGDNNLITDSAYVPYQNIIGKVALKIPQLGRVQAFVASSFGWLFLILIPALYIIFKDLFRVLKIKLNEKTGNSKWAKVLNRPLLLGKRPKLLPLPSEGTIESTESVTPIINIYPDDDEIEIDDLPKLK